jgi:hypothetical protein
VDVAFARSERPVPDLPGEPTFGTRQNVIGALTLSVLEAPEQDGIERHYAIELTGDICWRFYRHWGQGTRVATRLITGDPVRRLRLSVNAFLTFPFGRPGYRFDDVSQAAHWTCSAAQLLTTSDPAPPPTCAPARGANLSSRWPRCGRDAGAFRDARRRRELLRVSLPSASRSRGGSTARLRKGFQCLSSSSPRRHAEKPAIYTLSPYLESACIRGRQNPGDRDVKDE